MVHIDHSGRQGKARRAVLGVKLFDGYRPTLPVESCGPLVYDVYVPVLSLPIFNSRVNQSEGNVRYMDRSLVLYILPGSIRGDEACG